MNPIDSDTLNSFKAAKAVQSKKLVEFLRSKKAGTSMEEINAELAQKFKQAWVFEASDLNKVDAATKTLKDLQCDILTSFITRINNL